MKKANLKLIILFLILCVGIYGCRKDEETTTNNEFTVSKAKEYYIENKKTYFKSSLLFSEGDFNENTEDTIMWEKGQINTISEYSVVEVPVANKHRSVMLYNLGFTNGQIDDIRIENSFSRLMIYQDKIGKTIESKIITYIPDESFVRSYKSNNNNISLDTKKSSFTGFIEYRELNRKTISLFRIENGKQKENFSLDQKETNTAIREKLNQKGSEKTASVNKLSVATGCTSICTPRYGTVCAGPGGGNGPQDKDRFCKTELLGTTCIPVCSGSGPSGPVPGAGNGSVNINDGDTFVTNNNIDKTKAKKFSSVKELNDYVNKIREEISKNIVAEKTGRIRYNVDGISGIDVNVKLSNTENSIYKVENVTSGIWGLAPFMDWSQSDFSQNVNADNITRLEVLGYLSMNFILEDIGKIYSMRITFTIDINNRSGEFVATKVK